MADTAPSFDDYERVETALSDAAGARPQEPDSGELRAAIEHELENVPGATRARARFLGDLSALPAEDQDALHAIATMSDDAEDALAPALQVLAPQLEPMGQAALLEAFLTNELLRSQWELAYRTLLEPDHRA